jgi:hypothetical protein
MEIITREDARRRGDSKYFTGIPCKNNHLTYRYTQSGTCAGCIRIYNAPMEIVEDHQRRRDNLARLVTFRTRIADVDVGFISEMVLASVKAREPSAEMRDVFKSSVGVKRIDASGLHSFKCFAEDLQPLRDAMVKIFDSRCVQFVRAPVYQPPAEEWPEGDPR